MGHKKIAQDKMKNKKYHTVGTIQKYHTVGTIQKYHTVGTIQKYHTVGTIQKSNIKIVERGKIDTLNTQIHDRSVSCLGTGTSIKVRPNTYRKKSSISCIGA
jgi:uncharacterized pyridoxal phosphate-containing UPF0001 family protein